jgi:flap endonuclease-1
LFKGARKLFHEPNVLAGQLTENDMKIREVDEPGLIAFLVKEHAFSEERVLAALKRIKTFKQKSSQSRIDSFFKVLPKESSPQKKPAATKRKNEPAAAKGAAGKRGRKPK